MSIKQHDVIIIGGGFAGLATTAALRRYGVRNVRMLEAGQRYGTFWESNYDRISLHTAWHGLPDDGGENDRYPMFKTRDELLAYFSAYAEHHQLSEVTEFDTTVSAINRDPQISEHPWIVNTSKGEARARYVVVATGYCRKPVSPSFENQDAFSGTLIHSKTYRNGQPFQGKRMLVVGSGNSSAEISVDLVEAGAESVTMLVNGPRWFMPLKTFGEALIQAREMGVAGPMGLINLHPFTPGTKPFFDQLLGFDEMLGPLAEDLSEFGIDNPMDGPFTEFTKTLRVPTMDVGAAPLIRSGDIGVLKDRIASFTANGVKFLNVGEREFDGVILATGFEPGLEDFVPGECVEQIAAYGHLFPKTDGRCQSTVYADLYFVGFDQALMSGLALGLWGFETAEKIASAMGHFSPTMRPSEFERAPWEATA